jgi:hypothetical protein
MVAFPFTFNDPDVNKEPVTVWTSTIALPILTPVFVTWNSIADPVNTVKEPEITTFWFSGVTNEDVKAKDELTDLEEETANNELEAIVANDELTDLEEETANNELEAFIANDELIA